MVEARFRQLAQWVTADDATLVKAARGASRPVTCRSRDASLRGRCSPSPSRRRAASRCRPSMRSASGCCRGSRSRPACRRASRSSTTPPRAICSARRPSDADARDDGQIDAARHCALTEVIAYAADDRFDGLLREALGQRTWLGATSAASTGASATTPLRKWSGFIAHHFNVRHDADRAGPAARGCVVHSADAIAAAGRPTSRQGAVTDIDQRTHCAAALTARRAAARVAALRCYFLKSDGGERATPDDQGRCESPIPSSAN